jgi:D-amino-acid dehydrogenase
VIGGGVVGLACAWELTRAGCSVCVIERGRCGTGASRGNAGWITPFLCTPRPGPGVLGQALSAMMRRHGPVRVRPRFDRDFASWALGFWKSSSAARHDAGARAMIGLAAEAPAAYDRLREAGVQFEMHTDGLLVAALTTAGLDEFVRLYGALRERGYGGDARVIERSDLSRFEPALHDRVAGALYVTSDRHVRPETVSAGLAAALIARGASIAEGVRARALEPLDSAGWRIRVEHTDDVTCDRVVVACGADSKSLLRDAGFRLPLEPAKGVSVTARGRGTPPRRPIKMAEAVVACSPFRGAVRMSGTFDLGDGNAVVDRRRLSRVVESGLAYLRDWTPDAVEFTWAGLRPTTPDDRPAIGPVPGLPGVFVATGHGMFGVTLAAVTAELLAPLVVEERLSPLLAPFLPARFESDSASRGPLTPRTA